MGIIEFKRIDKIIHFESINISASIFKKSDKVSFLRANKTGWAILIIDALDFVKGAITKGAMGGIRHDKAKMRGIFVSKTIMSMGKESKGKMIIL